MLGKNQCQILHPYPEITEEGGCKLGTISDCDTMIRLGAISDIDAVHTVVAQKDRQDN